MMKRITFFLFLLMILFSVSACNQKDSNIDNERGGNAFGQREDERHMPMMGNNNPGRGQMNGMGHMMHRDMALQSSTGENELNVPALLEPDKVEGKDVYYTIEAQKGETEIFPELRQQRKAIMVAFSGQL